MGLEFDLLLLFLLLSMSAFFSAAEVAFLSMSYVRLHSLVEKKARGAGTIADLRSKKWQVIIAIIIWSTTVNIAASSITTAIAIRLFGEASLGYAIGAITFLLLTFGEIIPKSFASSNGERFILAAAPLLKFIVIITSPLVLVFEVINRLVPGVYSRAVGVEQFSEDEVRSAVKLGAKHKGISEQERKLIENVLEFNDKPVSSAMTPKSSVVALDGSMPVAVAHRKALENSMYSRFPVIQDGKVIGTVSVKIMGRALYQHPDWPLAKIAWKPVKIRSNAKVSEAFSRLQSLGRNIAIVVNEKDEFVGVVTLEDLLEEIVGELNRNPLVHAH
jgi:CBS domain containing-hemolysin-like protein